MEGQQPQQSAKAPHFQTTWIEGVVEFDFRKQPDGTVVLIYTLGNGIRYALPLAGDLLTATRAAVSPITVAGVNQMPRNSHGT